VKETKKLTEGAILLAIYIVMLLLFLYVPLIGTIISFILPVSFIYFSSKNHLKDSLLLLVAATILTFIVGGIFSIPITIAYGSTGIVIGWFIKEKKDRVIQYLSATVVFLVNLVLIYAISVVFLKVNIFDELIEILNESVEQSENILKMMGQSVDQNITESLNELVSIIQTLLPTFLVMAAALVVLLMIMICIPIVRKLGIDVEKAPPFRELSMPKSLLWYYLIVMLITLFVDLEKGTYIYTTIFNLFYILQTLMLIQGISFLFYYSHMKKISIAIPIIGTIFSFLIPILSSFIRILGIIDLGFNLRQRISK
jgi:uncharacterized protein YybS (DUF2232 family)